VYLNYNSRNNSEPGRGSVHRTATIDCTSGPDLWGWGGRSRGRALGEEHIPCTTVSRRKNIKGSLITNEAALRAASPFVAHPI
jgi:hypothetical protein